MGKTIYSPEVTELLGKSGTVNAVGAGREGEGSLVAPDYLPTQEGSDCSSHLIVGFVLGIRIELCLVVSHLLAFACYNLAHWTNFKFKKVLSSYLIFCL